MHSAVVIPTYNEKENIGKLVEAVLKLQQNMHILIVDDNSPDGTGQVADLLAEKYQEVEVIHRKGKLGLGTAYIEGFNHVLKNGAEYIFGMDADFSHNPESIPAFLKAIENYDLVIGSRYLHGIRVLNWDFRRLLLSKMATLYVRMATGLPVTDATGGFNCFRREMLESIHLDKIQSNGYSFLIEMKYKAYINGFRIGEIPIVFEDRRVGQSKMDKEIIIEALWIVWRLRFTYLLKKISSLFSRLWAVKK